MPSPELRKLRTTIDAYRTKLEELSARVEDGRALEELHHQFLSRKRGFVTRLVEELKAFSAEDRPEAGRLVNALKKDVQERLAVVEAGLKTPQERAAAVDLTLPGDKLSWGVPHPIRLFLEEILGIFLSMGYGIEEGPEIETDYYNFEALNFPPDHPARDSWDTLYINDKLLLRTHTSPVQVRVMEKRKPPIRIVIPGMVFRRDVADPTHIPMFLQLEGLVVDQGITFAHLKGTLEYFLKRLFGEKIKIRFRPSFFPFTEPSAEVDIECLQCGQKDPACRVCGGTGWKEILGSGMVDPQVFKNVNIDPERYAGWAFGLGIERTAMFALGIPDIRAFYENDLRFNRQFYLK
jgi:phenylalanyl-tRNA synthetase alpha chain